MPADGQASRSGMATVAGLGAVLPNADEPDDKPGPARIRRMGTSLCRRARVSGSAGTHAVKVLSSALPPGAS